MTLYSFCAEYPPGEINMYSCCFVKWTWKCTATELPFSDITFSMLGATIVTKTHETTLFSMLVYHDATEILINCGQSMFPSSLVVEISSDVFTVGCTLKRIFQHVVIQHANGQATASARSIYGRLKRQVVYIGIVCFTTLSELSRNGLISQVVCKYRYM